MSGLVRMSDALEGRARDGQEDDTKERYCRTTLRISRHLALTIEPVYTRNVFGVRAEFGQCCVYLQDVF